MNASDRSDLTSKNTICSIARKNQNSENAPHSVLPRLVESISDLLKRESQAITRKTKMRQRFRICMTERLMGFSKARSSFH